MIVNNKRADMLVLSFAALLFLGLIGMLFDLVAVMFLIAPAMTAALLYLSVSDLSESTGYKKSLTIIHVFNIVSLVGWVIAWLGLNTNTIFWGLPLSSGVIIYFLWPYYAIVGSLIYAYISKANGIVRAQADVAST
jgi:hypothetical protein